MEIEIKVGIFVAIGIALIMITILLLGGGSELFERNITYSTKFVQIEGLVEGANVKVAGIRVGQVKEVSLDNDKGIVDVKFTVRAKFQDSIHEDSTVAIQTQGVLGDRYLVVSVGSPGSPVAPEDAVLKSEPPKDLKDYLTGADQVIARINASLGHLENILGNFNRDSRSEVFFRNMTTASTSFNDGTKSMRASMAHLDSILKKIDSGHGTIGALVNDPSLYDDMKALLGGANRNRVLKYFIQKSVEDSKEAQKQGK